MNWTFLAGFYAGGKSDEEVTVHRIAGGGDTQGRGSRGAGGAAGAQARDQHGDLLPLEVEVRGRQCGGDPVPVLELLRRGVFRVLDPVPVLELLRRGVFRVLRTR